ncbi:hypothetical protein HYC85_002795 [Camellia sinensis]|uniref:Uncharacterized protein n=1 Tax=Camellia sinensis TaxID=4442 RepID=A0A7J7IAN4_CAMSI|nr:hypothetical protein HYC85_002795 [Camellia sinensis]
METWHQNVLKGPKILSVCFFHCEACKKRQIKLIVTDHKKKIKLNTTQHSTS